MYIQVHTTASTVETLKANANSKHKIKNIKQMEVTNTESLATRQIAIEDICT